MILGTVGHEIAHLFLGVIALDRHQHIVHAPAAARFGSETGIFLDFDGPSLVIHQMQMEHVELIACHLRNECLQILVWNEDAAWVYHQLSHMGARLVFHHQLRDGIAAYLRSIATKQLVESHQAIEYARCGLALDNHTLLLYFQGVCFLVWKALVQG